MAGTDDDISIDEKRVYGAKAERTDVFVAAEPGLIRVTVSGDKIGEFGIVHRDESRDVAVRPTDGDRPTDTDRPTDADRSSDADRSTDSTPDRLAIATPDDVLVAEAVDDPDFVETGFGSAVAVGADDGDLLAASADGTVSRLQSFESDAEWETLGTVAESDSAGHGIRAISGPLLASDAGVFRVVDGELSAVGLANVRDVAGRGVPLAATSDGLYWLGNGWMDALPGAFVAVASDGSGAAHAANESGALYTHEGSEWDADSWSETTLPVEEAVAALAYGPGLAVAVTDAGTVCVNAGDGWRHRAIGVRGVGGVAVARGRR